MIIAFTLLTELPHSSHLALGTILGESPFNASQILLLQAPRIGSLSSFHPPARHVAYGRARSRPRGTGAAGAGGGCLWSARINLVGPKLTIRHLPTRLFDSNIYSYLDSEQLTPTSVRTRADAQNWYCSLPGHDYFCEVHEDFIEDDFNLTGAWATARREPWLTGRTTGHGAVLEGGAGDGLGC